MHGAAPIDEARLQRARRAVAEALAGAAGLVGVGVGATAEGVREILVLVEAAGCDAARRSPRTCEGCNVRVIVSGKATRQ